MIHASGDAWSIGAAFSSTSATKVHVVAGCCGLELHVGSTRQLCFDGASRPKVEPEFEFEAVNNS
jgi:hypothetical protein